MKIFIYTIIDSTGKASKKKIKATNLNQVKAFLKRKKIDVLSIKPESLSLFQKLTEEKKVKADDIVIFSQLFSSCITTGLSIKESLSLLSKQIESPLLKNTIAEIIIDIESGNAISDAFKKHTTIFPPFYAMLLKAGEASGDLSGVLEYIGNYLEKINNLKKELISILTYPIVVSIVGAGLLTVILIFVAPTFKDVFGSSKHPLPFITITLFFLSDLIINNTIWIGVIGLTVPLLIITLSKSQKFKKKAHYFLITNPLFGNLFRQILLLQFLRTFDILVNNNVPILQSLQVLEEGTSNLCIKGVITDVRKNVSKGLPIANTFLNQPKIISPMIAYSISMGEKSGSLPETLSRLGKFLDKEVTFSMKKFTSKLDPMLTFGLGLIVLFIALAIYLPIFDMMATVGQ
jgi:type IV pilus assembly protein PilC